MADEVKLRLDLGGDECVADIDIDDAGGLGHLQVRRNTLTGRPTHPYDIHQKLDPGYRFQV